MNWLLAPHKLLIGLAWSDDEPERKWKASLRCTCGAILRPECGWKPSKAEAITDISFDAELVMRQHMNAVEAK